MNLTSKLALNQKRVAAIDPEIAKFFQEKINPNLTQEQIAAIIEPLQPKPNSIIGRIINLSYQENSNNLVEVEIASLIKIFTLVLHSNTNLEDNVIEVSNLNDYQARLQEAFNYKHLVEIYIENGKLVLLKIMLENRMRLLIGHESNEALVPE